MSQETITLTKEHLESLFTKIINDYEENRFSFISKESINSYHSKDYLDFKQACDFLCLSSSTLYKKVHFKLIRAINTGKKLIFKKEDLIDFLEKYRLLSIEDI